MVLTRFKQERLERSVSNRHSHQNQPQSLATVECTDTDMIWLRIPFQTSLLLMVFALAKVQEKPTHHIADHLSYEMQPRIIGGDETSPKRYPFMVSLRINGEHFCGGTLIAPDVILTAAHCTIIDFNAVTAVIGSHTIDGQTTMGENIEKISVQRVYSHPDYSSITNNYDMALVFLKESATSNVNYARLNSDIKIPTKEDTLTALGWGDTTAEDGYDFSNVLLEVNVDYMENDECDASKDSNNDSYEGMIKDTMLCASSPGKDGCQGDSGRFIVN